MSSTSQTTGSLSAKRELVYVLGDQYALHTLKIFAKALREYSDRIEKVRWISYLINPGTFDQITVEYTVGAINDDPQFLIGIGEVIRQVKINLEADGGIRECNERPPEWT